MSNKTNIEEDIKILEERLKDKSDKYNNLENEITELRERPVFYYDNNRNTYVWCCRCADSNMSLHMFLKNGEIQGYASEHYDKWVENVKEVKQVDVCEFMHKFVKPFIIKANKYDSLVEKIEEKKEKLRKEALEIHSILIKQTKKEYDYMLYKRYLDVIQQVKVLQELLDTEKEE